MNSSFAFALITAIAVPPAAMAQAPQAAGAAQSPVGGPAFEVVSMKGVTGGLGPSGVGYGCQGGPGTTMPERWTCQSVPLNVLVVRAWGTKFRFAGLPSANAPDNRYDITARVPPRTSMDDFQLMIRRLLQERVGLAMHQEQREISVTELVVAKGGIKMKEAEPAPPGAEPPPLGASVRRMEPPTAPGVTLDKDGIPHVPPGFPRLIQAPVRPGLLVYVGRMQSSADIARLVGFPGYGPVVDKTGLTGKYDFTLEFDNTTIGHAPAPGGAEGGAVPEASAPGLTLDSALKDQLGLEFHKGKTMADFLVVDHFNPKPTED
jgi:uncharacterized protein (TIGR03435 family)